MSTALGGVAAGLILAAASLAVRADEPVDAERAENVPAAQPKEQRPAVPGLPQMLQRALRGMLPGGRQRPRGVRAADEAQAEKTDARDPIDARAPRDPKLETLWNAANDAAQQGDWKRAVEALQRLLDLPEDAVHRAADGRWESLREAANRLLGTAPRHVLADYERQFGGLAQQLLTDPRRTDPVERWVEVATRFFHTDAGLQAANRLAAWHDDRREFALATRWYAELERAQAPFSADPRWRLKAAYAARQAQPELVRTFLDPVLTRSAGQPLQIGGWTVTPAEWWRQAPAIVAPEVPVLDDWWQLGGNAARIGAASGTEPLLLPLWSAPLARSDAVRRRLGWLLQDLEDERRAAILAGTALTVGEKVIYRDLRGLRVLDAATGRTLWESVPGLSPERILTGVPAGALPPGDAWRFRANMRQVDDEYAGQGAEYHPLASLLFRDAAYGQISSDGARVFVLEDHAVLTRNQPGYQWDGDADAADPFGAVWSSNRLSAYEVATGRSAWTVGGPESTEFQAAPLAGCFFFGAPVWTDSELLVVGARGEEVRLYALDPATGAPQWSQLIAYADTRIELDIARRWLGAPVAAGGGVVVCPTTVGWLVAVDRLRRSVLWAYRYLPAESDREQDPGTQFQLQRDLNGQWSVSCPVIVGDRVLVTPPDGDQLVCLGLVDGRVKWQRPRADGLYLAGVFGDRVVTIGMQSVAARSLADGQDLWSLSWDEDLHPTGRGVAVGHVYYLPLSNGELRMLDLRSGAVVGRTYVVPGQPPLGNLVVSHGRLISLGARGCVAFREKQQALAEIAARKARDPQDPTALLREAEMQILQREFAAALATLHAVPVDRLSPDLAERRRTALWTVLVATVRDDQADRRDVLRELRELAQTDTERLQVTGYEARRLLALGKAWDAFETLWDVPRHPQPEWMPSPDDPTTQVVWTAWLTGALRTVWEQATDDVRTQIDMQVNAAVDAARAGGIAEINRVSAWLGFHPAAARLAWRAAELYAEASDLAAAEAELLRWTDSVQPAVAAESQWRLAALWAQFHLQADAARLREKLAARFPKVAVSSGRTIAELLAALPPQPPQSAAAPSAVWESGKLQTQQSTTQYAPPVQELVPPDGLRCYEGFALQIEPQEQRLTMQERASGRWHWLAPLRSAPRSDDHGYTPVSFLGTRLLVWHRDVLQLLSPVEKRVVWTRIVDLGEGGGAHRSGHRAPASPLIDVTAEDNDYGLVLSRSSERGRLTVANPQYLAVLGRRNLTLLDARTGRERWRKTGLSPFATVVGGRDFVCIVEQDELRATAFRSDDGQPLAIPDLPKLLGRTLDIRGNDLIVAERTQGLRLFNINTVKTALRRFDPVGGAERWRVDLKPGTQVGLVADGLALAVEPAAGGAQAAQAVDVIDLDTGARRPLAPTSLVGHGPPDEGMYAFADGDRFYLIANSGNSGGYHYGDSVPSVPAHGALLAWDRQTGALLWKRTVSQQNLVLDRLSQSPVLLLVSRQWKQQGNSSYTTLNLLALSKHSGKVLHESVSAASFSGFHGVAVRETEPAIELVSYNLRLKLTPASETAPPAPAPP